MSSMEIYMGKKLIFPYNLLGGMKSYIEEDSETYNLYFVLLGDRYEIIDECPDGDKCVFVCQNMRTETRFKASIDIPKWFGLPSCSYIKTTIYGSRSILEIDLSKSGEAYYKDHYPDRYAAYIKFKSENDCNYVTKLHTSTLFNKFRQAPQQESVRYKVLYIGKSQNIFNRLNNHSTIQAICRDQSYSDTNAELFIMISGAHGKLIEDTVINDGKTSVMLGCSLHDQFKLFGEAVNRERLIDIAEAMLISSFLPKYNNLLKKREGNKDLRTYRRLGETELTKVHFSLDLTFDEANILITLEAPALTAKGVAAVITCEFQSNSDPKIDVLCLPYG